MFSIGGLVLVKELKLSVERELTWRLKFQNVFNWFGCWQGACVSLHTVELAKSDNSNV